MADKYRPFIGKQRGNKLWEGNRIILPEHSANMLELERNRDDRAPSIGGIIW